MANVAEVLVETLNNAGVKRIYGIVGDSLNGITNALKKYKDIEWVHVRHEEAAAFAAGAEAQLTGELAVCAGSCGPGNLHLINGLYDCQRSGAPVLAIAAHIPSPEVGGDYFQETHPNILFKECSCFCEVVTTPEQMPRLLNIAMQTAKAKSGVAVLVISGDVALQQARYLASKDNFAYVRPDVVPPEPVLQDIAARLNAAKNVTVFCGIGAANAQDELMRLCHTLQAPVIHTLRAKPFIEPNNPYDVGMTGFIGFSSGYHAMEACDTLLLLGTNFPYRQFYPTKAQIIQIDLHGEQLKKRVDLAVGAVGDIACTLKALLPLLSSKQDSRHLEKARAHYQKARQGLDALATQTADKKPLHPQFLAQAISQVADDDTVFTVDVGTPTVWAARYLRMNGKRRLLGSFNHGSMANALSQAIGAQASYPERQVVALCGDGGFAMLMGDILTLVQHQLPIKIVIFNNSALGFVEMEMHVGGMLDYATSLVNPNFAALAQSVGIKGIRVDSASALDADLHTAFAHDGPVIIDVAIHRNELIIPPTIEAAQVKGFSLYMMKAIINGQGNAILDLMKTNLWRGE
ncbi:ubiquinone-dependent pyruvate dehydrogenase [Legionella drancourtii]|uniref:Pyruvate dehydrogenase [ubiquinone] n=1 Tax=Legionella drancourtii LLAP12 TaxID=658187 RepID=G9EJR8_9GAMM|nr:ubiquinone-dependent pyruvate dehydrogenase [Legionella drancourtii]EHL32478.1 thiamine pyrophosphate protein domain protein TPP-binding [Legionella drancourtii LLAP12]